MGQPVGGSMPSPSSQALAVGTKGSKVAGASLDPTFILFPLPVRIL